MSSSFLLGFSAGRGSRSRTGIVDTVETALGRAVEAALTAVEAALAAAVEAAAVIAKLPQDLPVDEMIKRALKSLAMGR